jgi:copper transport protein
VTTGRPPRRKPAPPGSGSRLVALVFLVLAGVLAGAGIVAGAPAARAATAAREAGTAFTALSGRAGLAVPAAPALFAHAALASTQPADGSVVAKEPPEVSASFDQQVGISASSLMVYSPGGQRVDDGQTVHVSAFEISVGLLSGMGNGTYTAVWHVISADTHPVEGAFTFSVGAPSATHVGALLPASDDVVSDLFAVVRWVEYLCFAVLGGGVAFLIICWPEGGKRRGARGLVFASSLGLLLSTLAGLLLQGPYEAGTGLSQVFSGTLIRETMGTSLGPASYARELMALLSAVFAAFLLPRLPAASLRARRAFGAVWTVLSTGVALSWAVYDHASTGVQAPWGVPVDVVHLDAMALWIGGLAVLAGFALRGTGPGSVAVARAVPRFSKIAFGCVIALVASGGYQTWREVGSWGAQSGTAYGKLVLAKIAGLTLLVVLGYLARRFIQRGLSRAILGPGRADQALGSAAGPVAASRVTATGTLMLADTAANSVLVTRRSSDGPPRGSHRRRLVPGSGWEPSMRRLRRSVALELGMAAVILALSAVLVNTATGREAYAPTLSASQAFNTGGPGGSGVVHVFAGPARLGPNTVEVYFTTASGRAFRPAQVTAALYYPAKDIGPLPVTLTQTAAGQYRTQDATVTFTGQWTLQVIVRSDAFDETSVTFPLNIH